MAEKYDFSGLTKPSESEYNFEGLQKPSYNFEGLKPIKEQLMEPVEDVKTSKTEAAITGLGQGATLGFGDELAGFVGAGLDKLGLSRAIERMQGVPEDLLEPEKSFGEYYKETRDLARRQQAQAEKDQPGAYLGGQVVGGIATGVATGGVGPQALMTRAALEGGAYGLGASEADLLKGEYSQAAVDTAKGAIAGVALPAGVKGIKAAGTGLKEAGKIITGLGGQADELAVTGASKVLGVAENELTPEIVKYLKDKGLSGLKVNKDQIVANIQKEVDELNKLQMNNPFVSVSDIPQKALDVMQKSEASIVKEAIRSGKNVDIGDVASLALGPKAFAAKKARDLASSRAQMYAPEIYSGIEKAGTIGKKVINAPVIKQSLEGTGKLYNQMTKQPAIRVPYGQMTTEMGLSAEGKENAFTQIKKYAPTSQIILSKTQGTKYQNVFNPENMQQNAVRHKLLMERDPEYRALYNEQLNEE